MDSIYNKTFFNDFYEENGGGNYMDREHWLPYFRNFAKQIVEIFEPKTVLDAGCARGYLVECLRDLGVEAYGFDLSEYAIANVREDIQDCCFVHSITESIPEQYPQRYDLVVTVEVLEHLFPEDGNRAIANLCSLTDKVIFSSTPDDIEDKTHVNVRLREYWAKVFWDNGFHRDLYNDVSFVSPWCVIFAKTTDVSDVIFSYEMDMRIRELQREKNPIKSTVYSDYGKGFTDENMMRVTSENNKIDFHYRVPANVKNLRFDVVQEAYCVLGNIEIYLDGKIINDYIHNGVQNNQNVVFTTKYPQMIIRGVSSKELSIRAMYRVVDNEVAHVYKNCVEALKLENAELSQVGETRLHKIRVSDQEIVEKNQEIAQKAQEIGQKNQEIGQKNQEIEQLRIALDDIRTAHDGLIHAYGEISNSFFWSLTKPVRTFKDKLNKKKTIESDENADEELELVVNEVQEPSEECDECGKTIDARYVITAEERSRQTEFEFSKNIKFSIVVPLYNTPENFLVEMIESVRNQTYTNWELCLADGSTDEYACVETICMEYVNIDNRIKYEKLKENLGISGNTNACLEMVSGDYIGLFDHDDLLHESVLYYYMEKICDLEADFIYCDEVVFQGDMSNVISTHYKPDFAIDNLRANNYICHFSVFAKSLSDAVGGFRKEYDGSQDHDMILRLTQKATNIVHVPKPLYFWRCHPNSVASDISSKTYAIQAGKDAVKEHLRTCGYEAQVESTKAFAAIYGMSYALEEKPLISIIILNRDSKDAINNCVESIKGQSTYSNYEIIIVTSHSSSSSMVNYYEKIKKESNIQVVSYNLKESNTSDMYNYGAIYAHGQHLLFLDSNTEVITSDFLENMLMYSARQDVGVVGAKLYYRDDTIHHAGLILGVGPDGIAGYGHQNCTKDNVGYMGRLYYAQNVSAVASSCLMVEKTIFEEVGGFDTNLLYKYHDVDLCLKIRGRGYLNIWTPFAELYYDNSPVDSLWMDESNKGQIEKDDLVFKSRWNKALEKGDPYFNSNFNVDYTDFRLK